MYKIYEDTYKDCSYIFSTVTFLSTTVLRIHSDGDFVAESGRELLDIALEKLVWLRIRCIITGHRRIFGNSLHGRLIFSFSLFSEVRPLQGRDELVLQPGHDRAVGRLVYDAVSTLAIWLLWQEFQSGWLFRLTLVRPYSDSYLAAGDRFRDLCAVGR